MMKERQNKENRKNRKNGGNRRNSFLRIAAALFAAVLAMPSLAYAEETSKAVQQIHHVHIGNAEEGGSCYETEVKHVHEGDEEKGGNCFLSPIYHAHDGDEKKGGECYRTEVFHAHEGTEADGAGCYGQPVYHAHEGSTKVNGGCYGQPVYHKHTGSGSTGGGCYGLPVYHKHTGSQASKGGCYGTPVYHKHTGSTAARGGCYQKAVYHTHAGNETSGGACYGPIYHKHTAACYQEAQCIMEYGGSFQIQREENGYCYHHGDTNIVYYKADYRHSSCGKGVTEEEYSICWTCHNLDTVHTYSKVICGKTEKTVEGYQHICGKGTDTVESWDLSCGKSNTSVEQYALSCGKNEKTVDSYQLNCNKNEKTVDSYQLNCNKTEAFIEKYALNCGKTEESVDSYAMSCVKNGETIDGYALSCEKTEETVDGYALSCQKSEEDGYAEFSISNQNSQWTSGEVTLQAAFSDPDGFLQLSSDLFRWEGKGISNVELGEVKVKENGVYYVHLKAENEDVDKKELVLSIEVNNIDHTAPSIERIAYVKEEGVRGNAIRVTAKDTQPDGSPGSGLAEEAYSFDGGKSWQKENTFAVSKKGVISIAVRDCCGNISVQDVEIMNIGEEDKENNKEDEKGNGKEDGKGDNQGDGTGGNGSQGKGDAENGKGNGNEGNGEGNGDAEDGKGSGNEGNGEGNGDAGDGQGGNADGGSKGDGSQGKGDTENGKGSGNQENGEGDGKTGNGQGGNADGGLKANGNLVRDENAGKEQGAKKGALWKNANASKKAGINGDASEGNGTDGNAFKESGTNGKEEGIGEEDEVETERQKVTFPDKKEKYEEETVLVEIPRTGAGPENGSRSKIAMKVEAVGKVVKAVTFTVSSIMLASGFIYLIYLMFRSIQIYDCDGEGRIKYAGSCIMKKTEEGFEVRIPHMIWERSDTGQYSLRPSRIFVKRNKGKELIVIAGERKEPVWIDREIPLRVMR